MKRFPDHSRVLFIGDSITCNGLWVAHIFDYYLRHFPASDIRMYNAGISGGSVRSAVKYYDIGNGDNFKPTHAVIMLGINDIGRGYYDLPSDASEFENLRVPERMQALNAYKEGLCKLADMLLSRDIKLTFVAPTGFDESQHPRELNTIGCDAGMEYIAELNRRLAAETGSDFVNLHASMRLLNTAKVLTGPDRVHPIEQGHVCMAYTFLAAQGLSDEPLPDTIETLPAPDTLLNCNKVRWAAEKSLRRLWNAEWLLLQHIPVYDEEARRVHLRDFRKTSPTGFWSDMVDHYFALDGNKSAALEELLRTTEACLKA